MTKQQEKDILSKIKDLVSESGEGSHIELALRFGVQMAETNINYGFQDSVEDLLLKKDQQLEKARRDYEEDIANYTNDIDALKHIIGKNSKLIKGLKCRIKYLEKTAAPDSSGSYRFKDCSFRFTIVTQ